MFGIKIKFRKKISDISIFLTKFFHNRVRNRRLVKVLFKIVCVKRTYSKYKQLNTSYALKKQNQRLSHLSHCTNNSHEENSK